MLAELFVAFPEVRHLLRPGRRAGRAAMLPARRVRRRGRPNAQRIRLRDTRRRPARAGHRRARRAPPARHGSASGRTCSPATATASWSRSAPPARSTPPTLLALSRRRAEAILAAVGDGDPGTMAAVAAPADEVAARCIGDRRRGRQPQRARAGRDLRCDRRGARRRREVLRRSGPDVQADPGGVRVPQPGGRRRRRRASPGAGRARSPRAGAPGVVEPHRPPYPSRRRDVRAELAEQIGSPVRFVEQIERCTPTGARVFVEAGPGTVLSGLVDEDPRRPAAHAVRAVVTAGLRGFLGAAAPLAVSGVDVRHRLAVRGRDAHEPTSCRHETGLDRRRPARAYRRRQLPPRRSRSGPTSWRSRCRQQPAVSRDALVAEFLRTNREIVAAQRDVLLSYLGTAPAGTRVP